MKVSPVAAPANTVATGVDPQAARIQATRSLRMNTNATPGRVDPQVEQLPPGVAPAPPLSTGDTNDPASGDEATQPLSPQYAAIARQRRALQVKERELADREKALASQPATQADAVPLARLKSEPLSVLLEAGVTYDQLTEAILASNDGSAPQIQALKSEIKALKEGVDKTLTDRDAQAEKQALAEMQKEATQLSAEGEDFEMVRETKSIPDVMQLIERTYRESGEVLDVKEAMQLVEDELVSRSLKIAGLKKVQNKLQPTPSVPTTPPQQQRQMRTLTNKDTASVPLSPKARALAAFYGTLKK